MMLFITAFLCAILITLSFKVTAHDPPFGEGFHSKITKALEGLRKKFEDLGSSNDSCIQLGKKLAMKIVPAQVSCIREIPSLPHIQCLGKCVGMKLKIYDESGSPNLMNAKSLMDDVIPERFKEQGLILYEKCQSEIAGIKGDDPTCESHHLATKCITGAMSSFTMETLKLCPEIPDRWKSLIEMVAKNIQ